MQLFWRNRGAIIRWLLAALAETAVAIPWVLLLYTSSGQPTWYEAVPGAWLPLAVYLTAVLWELGTRRESPSGRVVAMVLGAVLSYLAGYGLLPASFRTGLLAFNPAMSFLLIGAYLWYRGARSAMEGLSYGQLFSQVYVLFGTQLGGIFLLLSLGHGRESQVQLLLIWAVVLLFAAGLTLLIVTRERAQQADSVSVSPTVTVVSIGMLLLTLIASSLITVERLDALLSGVNGIVSPVYNWLVSVGLLLLVRWAKLFEPLFWRLQQWAEGLEPPPPPEGETDVDQLRPESVPDPGPAPDYTPLVRALLLLVALALLARWLYQLNRGRRRAEAEAEEERTSLGVWRSLMQDLRSLFSRAGAGRKDGPGGDGGLDAVDPRSPRGLFRRLQRWGAAQGRPRRPAETPLRYGDSLAALRPEAAEPAAAVAAVYNQARYGAAPPDPDAVAAAAAQLDELRM